MKKTKTVLLLFLALFLATGISSCKKDDDDDNNNIATCTDGIKNQGETGVDCGGPCTPCPVNLCSDGILNQGETAIDCGGPCTACPTFYLIANIDGAYFSASGSAGTFMINRYRWPDSTMANMHLAAGGAWSSGAGVLMHKNLMNYSGPSNNEASYMGYEPGTFGFHNDDISVSEGGYIEIPNPSGGGAWSSAKGDNTGSTFTITERGPFNGPFSTYTTFKGTFSCKLYDDNGNMRNATGSFSAYAGF